MEIIDAVIAAAEKTAAQASGNDKDDWNNFAKALRVERKQLEDAIAAAPRPEHPIAPPPTAQPKT